MSLQLLEFNWNQIQKKVVLPLWHKDFKNGYETVKMDFDDFQSLANYELTKAFKRYDKSLGNIFTYSTMIIKRKAASELRNAKREKREAMIYAKSIYETIEDSDIELQSVIEDTSAPDINHHIMIESAVDVIYNFSKPKEKKILSLLQQGFSEKEITKILKIEPKAVGDLKRRLNDNSSVRRAIRKTGYLGGFNNEE